jgi:hypothetical protein
MWNCKPCATPLDANSRLSKADWIALKLWTQPSIAGIAVYWMLVVFGEHGEARSRVCIFSVEQVCMREWYIYKLLSECYNMCVVLMIKESLIVTLELKSRTN